MSGRLYVGTSGFAYPRWTPAFYPPGTQAAGMLPYYAQRLDACELNNTYYQQPSAERIRAWLSATPDAFRFSVKAHRAGSAWAFNRDPEATLGWLAKPFRDFADRLGTVLFRVTVAREADDARLERFLAAWPSDLPLTMEFQHPSWLVDDVFETLRSHRAALCVTDLPDSHEPDVRATAPFVYLRLRRDQYPEPELQRWTNRLLPFLDDGRDAYIFFRHDESGEAAHRALALKSLVEGASSRRSTRR